MKTKMGPWRSAINWYLTMLILGSVVATVIITFPFFLAIFLIYGFPPPEPSWTVLRILQIFQAIVISCSGGYLALRYFQMKYDVSYGEMRGPLKILAIGVPVFCLLILIGISIPKYGLTLPLFISSTLIFGTFTLAFLLAGFHYAKKLNMNQAGIATSQSASNPQYLKWLPLGPVLGIAAIFWKQSGLV